MADATLPSFFNSLAEEGYALSADSQRKGLRRPSKPQNASLSSVLEATMHEIF